LTIMSIATPPLSLAALTVLELAPADMVTCAAHSGYDYVGLRLIPATNDERAYPIIGDTPMVREIATRLDDTGISVLDVEILRLRSETNVADYRAALETAARLRARYVLVAGNDADERRLTDNLAALARLAAPMGLSLALEPMPWTDVRTVRDAARIVEYAAQPNAGVLVDAIHFDRGENSLADLVQLPRHRLPYVQLCDAPAARPRDLETLLHQARAERLMPGDGEMDLVGLLRAMPRDVPISLEIPLRTLARTVDAHERARRVREKTLALLAKVDGRE
jgi:sugar phosphate isomerase/epimerase